MYLISFASQAMLLTDEEFPIVAAEAHAVIEEAKATDVYVFGCGIVERVAPVLVTADGSVMAEIYPGTETKGGSPSSSCRTAKLQRGGREGSLSLAAAHRNYESSGTTQRARCTHHARARCGRHPDVPGLSSGRLIPIRRVEPAPPRSGRQRWGYRC